MLENLDFRFGTVTSISPLSVKNDSPRRKFCTINIDVPEIGNLQSIGQFARHVNDLEGELVLCIVNLGHKIMFGRPSQALVLGVPHPAGGVITGDHTEAQATFLAPCKSLERVNLSKPKVQTTFDTWVRADLRLAKVVEQTSDSLTVDLGDEVRKVALKSTIGAFLLEKTLIVYRDPDALNIAELPQHANGDIVLACPKNTMVPLGAKVF